MYISVMIGGGMLYIDDKARGVHEGYLVTPITKLELVMGLNIAGAIKAVLAGISLTVIGSLMAGLGVIFNPIADLQLLAADPRHLNRLQRHDVPDDGARRRSARAARHVRRPQHAAVLSLRRHLSHRGISQLAARHRRRRSLHLLPSTASRQSFSKTAASPPFSTTCSSCLSSASARCSSPPRSSSERSKGFVHSRFFRASGGKHHKPECIEAVIPCGRVAAFVFSACFARARP